MKILLIILIIFIILSPLFAYFIGKIIKVFNGRWQMSEDIAELRKLLEQEVSEANFIRLNSLFHSIFGDLNIRKVTFLYLTFLKKYSKFMEE